MAALTDVLVYIANEADGDDIATIVSQIKERQRILMAKMSAGVAPGVRVTIRDISPKYLIGLVGDVQRIEGKIATVLFDEESTNSLRYGRQTRFHIAPGVDRYELGVPRDCCSPVGDDD